MPRAASFLYAPLTIGGGMDLHHRARADDAKLLADAFKVDEPQAADSGPASNGRPGGAAAFLNGDTEEAAIPLVERV